MQPPKLKPPAQKDLPRTPYPIPSKGCKRSGSFSKQDNSSQEGEAKRLKIAGGGIPGTPPYLASFPSLESGCPANCYRIIPPMELMKAWESIFDQVDWSEVMQEAGGREKLDIYRNVFKMIFYSHIEEQLKHSKVVIYLAFRRMITLGRLDRFNTSLISCRAITTHSASAFLSPSGPHADGNLSWMRWLWFWLLCS